MKNSWRSSFDAHIAPHTIEVASMFAIMTRLTPSAKVDPLTKLKIYNGEEIVEKGSTKKVDIMELKEQARREGMTGISNRFIVKAIDTALSESDHNCVNPIAVLDTLVKAVKEMVIAEEEKKRYLGFCRIPSRKNTISCWKKK